MIKLKERYEHALDRMWDLFKDMNSEITQLRKDNAALEMKLDAAEREIACLRKDKARLGEMLKDVWNSEHPERSA